MRMRWLYFILSVLVLGPASDFIPHKNAQPQEIHLSSELPALPDPLKEARTNVVNLVDWRFQPDPQGIGEQSKWMDPGLNDSTWPILKAKATWQKQGFPDLRGSAWYRVRETIPTAWSGSKILLQTTGIYNQFDLYVNGQFVRHYGSDEQSLAWDPSEPELTVFLKYGSANVIALKVTSSSDNGGIYRRIQLRRVPPFESYKKFLPAPVVDAHPELVELYWQSWRMAFKNVSFGTPENNFVPAYMEEGYNEQIYQWDSIFMTMYGRYGDGLFPAMPTLDNFYNRQKADGFIARIYSKTDGGELLSPVKDEFTLTNPALFSWAEWDYYRMTGDDGRLARVFPILEKYDQWLKHNQQSPLIKGMYWQTGFDSGMDNMPRPNMVLAGWVDATLEQAVAAKYLARIATHLGKKDRQQYWQDEFAERAEVVNRLAWNAKDGFYYDVDRNGHQTGVKHVGAMWALLAGVASPDQARRLQEHLRDPREFYRPHLFPALSVSDPGFTKEASYWRGGVWAPTNYMIIRGLKDYGYEKLAYKAALNHLQSMFKVYSSKIDETHVDPNEASPDYKTIWECYNPNHFTPCTRADATHYGRQDFAGWTALGPVALLIQEIVGLEIIGADNRVEWTLHDQARTGLANMRLRRDNVFSVMAEAGHDTRTIKTTAQKPFTLVIRSGKVEKTFDVPAGETSFQF